MMMEMRSKEVTGLVALLIKQPYHYVLATTASLLIGHKLLKVTLNYPIQSMPSVMITELEGLVENDVQDTLYHMTPLTVSV